VSGAVPWFDEVVAGPIRRDKGWWSVPDCIGLGVEVDLEAAGAASLCPGTLLTAEARAADGVVVDW
jgi:galactonate dehydratase